MVRLSHLPGQPGRQNLAISVELLPAEQAAGDNAEGRLANARTRNDYTPGPLDGIRHSLTHAVTRGGWPNRKDQPASVPRNNSVNDQKGFGFISPDDGGADIFAHHTSIEMPGFKTLAENQKVEFTVEKTDKGLRAKTVVPVR